MPGISGIPPGCGFSRGRYPVVVPLMPQTVRAGLASTGYLLPTLRVGLVSEPEENLKLARALEIAMLDNPGSAPYLAIMAATAPPVAEPGRIEEIEDKPKSGLEPGYLVVCWN